jgi:hypothetical protein
MLDGAPALEYRRGCQRPGELEVDDVIDALVRQRFLSW